MQERFRTRLENTCNNCPSHGVSPRDSHEISPAMGGGVHKLMLSLRDLSKETLQKVFGEEIGGVRGTQTPLLFHAL